MATSNLPPEPCTHARRDALQAVVSCINGLNKGAPEYSTTPTLTLVYDTRPPLLVTDVAALARTTYQPGNMITLSYSEDLLCTRPYAFQIQLRSGTTVLFDSSSSEPGFELPLRCVASNILLVIPGSVTSKISLDGGATVKVQLRLVGVSDQWFNSDLDPTVIELTLAAPSAILS